MLSVCVRVCCCLCLNIAIFLVKGIGKYGVLFYNSLIIIIPTLLASAFTGDLHKVLTVFITSFSQITRPLCIPFPFDHPACCGTTGSHVRRLGWSWVYNVLPRVLLHGVGLPQVTLHAVQSLHCATLKWWCHHFTNSCCVLFLSGLCWCIP